MKERPVLFTAEAVADAGGVLGTGPAACLLVDVAPVALGELPVLLATAEAARHDDRARSAQRVHRPGAVLLPGLVNAHTHLDLTQIGPQPHDPTGGFVKWIEMVRSRREARTEGIAEAVRVGIELSRRGGTLAIGDIAGAPAGKPTTTPWETLADSEMLGVSFLEFFAIGKGADRGATAISELVETCRREGKLSPPPSAHVRVGLQPHAPNTVGLAGYRRAVELASEYGLPLSTHLAETWEEREFITHARGGQRELLERLGVWDDAMLAEIGRGEHPVQHLHDVLAMTRFAVAHVNDADAAAIQILARTQTSVVYCPRASAYFGADRRFGPHRYRDMLAAGIPVALGTDSIINLDTPDRISVLDEMRFLHRRDAVDAVALLRMATVNGAIALGLNPGWFQFRTAPPPSTPQRIAGLISIEIRGGTDDPLHRLMASNTLPEILLHRKYCCETGIEPI